MKHIVIVSPEGNLGFLACRLRKEGYNVDLLTLPELSILKGLVHKIDFGMPLHTPDLFIMDSSPLLYQQFMGQNRVLGGSPFAETLPDKAGVILEASKIAHIKEGELIPEGVRWGAEAWFYKDKFIFPLLAYKKTMGMLPDNRSDIVMGLSTVQVFDAQDRIYKAVFKKLIPVLSANKYVGPVQVDFVVSEDDHKLYALQLSATLNKYGLLESLIESMGARDIGSWLMDFYDGKVTEMPMLPMCSVNVKVVLPVFFLGDEISNSFMDLPMQVQAALNRVLQSMQKIDCSFKNPLDVYMNKILSSQCEINMPADLPHVNLHDIEVVFQKVICAGADGYLASVTGAGDDIKDARSITQPVLEALVSCISNSSCFYRTDVGVIMTREYKKLKRWGYFTEDGRSII